MELLNASRTASTAKSGAPDRTHIGTQARQAELCLAIKHARHEAEKRLGPLCPDVGAICKE